MGGFYGKLLSSDVGRVFRSRAEAREGEGGRPAEPREGGGGSPAEPREGGGGSPADKATALAAAQRDLIVRGGRYAHPYYWGAFVLVGQM
jgi:hypothetical protein